MNIDMTKLQESADRTLDYHKQELTNTKTDLENHLYSEVNDQDSIYNKILLQNFEKRIAYLGNIVEILSEEFTEQMYEIAYHYHQTLCQFEDKWNIHPKKPEWEKLHEVERRMFYKIVKAVRETPN
jgi:hypothetical protein